MPESLAVHPIVEDARARPALDVTETEIVHAGIEQLEETAIRAGLEITIETDFAEFARLRQAGGGSLNQTIDPRHSRLDRDAFWLRATAFDGTLAGMYAAKVFRVANFMDLLHNERLWFDRGPNLVTGKQTILDAFAPFGGVVSHGAGLWVNPVFRGRRLSSLLPEYVRALAVKLHAVDWHTGLFMARDRDHARRAYGFTHIELVIDGFCHITGPNSQVCMGLMSRRTILDRLQDDLSAAVLTRADPRVPAVVAG